MDANVYLNIPYSDLSFFEILVKKMGWKFELKESLLQKYIDSRPTNVELSENEILEELSVVRYQK